MRRKNKKNNLIVVIFHALILSILVLGIIFISTKKKSLLTPSSSQNQEVKKISTLEKERSKIEQEISKVLQKIDLIEGTNFSFTKMGNASLKIEVVIDKNRFDLTYINLILVRTLEDLNINLMENIELIKGQKQQLIAKSKDGKLYTVILRYSEKTNPFDKPILAIIVDDFGAYQGELLDKFCKADKRISFAILPNLPFATSVMNKSIKFGHEVLIHIPMEPISYPQNSPGENAIFTGLTSKQIASLTQSYIEILPKAIGANNHMGSLATQDKRVMLAVLEVLKENSLFFIDSRTINTSIAYDLARENLVPTAKRDLFLDVPNSSIQVIDRKLDLLKRWKTKKEKVIAISHCFDESRLENLLYFIKEAEQLGYQVVPISKFFKFETVY